MRLSAMDGPVPVPSRMVRHAVVAGLLGLAFGFSSPVAADPRAEAIAFTCMGCHGVNGISVGSIPSLAGRPAVYMTQTMLKFKSGERDGTLMNRIAKGYSDAELRAVSEYFSALPLPTALPTRK